jgi:undecaprenyl phosphate N,N'-diacetylbacillosamine 1-phosphate transferase
MKFYQDYFKRLFDLVLAFICLFIFMPMALIIFIISSFLFRGQVFFFQNRLGYHQKVFVIFKFRTMNEIHDNYGNTLPDSERINSWGYFLRKYSLDEIPQLINILKGDISFVGPRPLLVEYQPFYSKEEIGRHEVKPGLTGLAQVKGRNSISWEKRFLYDMEYIKNISFTSDVKILMSTIVLILSGQKEIYSRSLLQERSAMPLESGSLLD